jgi:predicted phage terminase large subunit-like protein
VASSLGLIGRVARLKKLRAERRRLPTAVSTELRAKSLGPFIPRLSPDYAEPRHLSPLLFEFERLVDGKVRICVSVPPRHGKSETLLHGIAWLLLRDPKRKILYVTHTATFAIKQSKAARRLARIAGVQISDESNRADEWETTAGGGLTARGIDGDITGRGFDLVICDDPVKGVKAAESSKLRAQLFQWFTSDVTTRLTPKGSVIVVHTRWHVDDLSGRLIKEKGYRRLNIRAVAVGHDENEPANDNWVDPREEGEALWPEGGWDRATLDERRADVGEYTWWALFQGEPRPRGGNVFGEANFYDELPKTAYRVGFGIDLAYTAKTHADYSVCVEIWREETQNPKRPKFYIVEVLRKQVDAPSFTLTLKAKHTERPNAKMRWYASGTEKGSGDFIKKQGIPLQVIAATADKFVRAQPLAAAWNAGDVLIPNTEKFPAAEKWVVAFLDEFQEFTGVNDVNDDQIDAAAAGHDVLVKASGSGRSFAGKSSRS